MVGAILAMAQRLGLRVIAEGVETAAQHQYLRAHDCDEAQGFLYSPGIPAEDLVQRLAAIEAAAATSPAGESGAHAA